MRRVAMELPFEFFFRGDQYYLVYFAENLCVGLSTINIIQSTVGCLKLFGVAFPHAKNDVPT
jgi:hypothetical protein